ncbi:MAG: TonB family protein [Alphaproteobacteria bacterium]|nr:TonB family protein [Alphaproteobacteria bacterium]
MTPGARHALRWTASLALVLTAHLGGAAALLAWRAPQESPPAAPVVMIDLADTPSAPSPDRNDIPPGPLLEISQPPPPDAPATDSAALARLLPPPEPPQPVIAQALPQLSDQLPPPREPPEVVLDVPPPKPAAPKPPPAPRSRQIPPRHTAEQHPPRPPTPDRKPKATQSSAPSGAPAPQAVAAAPAPGVASPPSPKVVRRWQASLLAHLQRHKRYPGAARDKNDQGTVYLRFAMNRGGMLLASDIARASGHPVLDSEALAMVARAQPLPAPPDDMPGERFEFIVPVQFQLR